MGQRWCADKSPRPRSGIFQRKCRNSISYSFLEIDRPRAPAAAAVANRNAADGDDDRREDRRESKTTKPKPKAKTTPAGTRVFVPGPRFNHGPAIVDPGKTLRGLSDQPRILGVGEFMGYVEAEQPCAMIMKWAGSERHICVVNLVDGSTAREFTLPRFYGTGPVTLSPDLDRVATRTSDVIVYQFDNDTATNAVKMEWSLFDSSRLYLHFIDADLGEPVGTCRGKRNLFSFESSWSMTRDGRRLAARTRSGERTSLSVFDFSIGQHLFDAALPPNLDIRSHVIWLNDDYGNHRCSQPIARGQVRTRA